MQILAQVYGIDIVQFEERRSIVPFPLERQLLELKRACEMQNIRLKAIILD